MTTTGFHAIVRGRVQGVGFRVFVYEEAVRLGLRGWVRNRPDGTVEVVATGDAPGLDRLIERIRRGPPASRVDSVDVSRPLEPSPEFTRFELRG